MEMILILILLVLVAVIIDALRSSSVWVKGNSFSQWFYKIKKEDEPFKYWVSVASLSAVALFVIWLLLFGDQFLA